MTPNVSEEAVVSFKSADVMVSAQDLIAASSILGAVTDQYSHTGTLSLGAVLHAQNVIDHVIDRLDLTEILLAHSKVPF